MRTRGSVTTNEPVTFASTNASSTSTVVIDGVHSTVTTDSLRKEKVRRSELMGTLFAPKLRWWCSCGQSNVSRLGAPVAKSEKIFCSRCRRMTVVHFEKKRET